jgi:hypothetical protein
LFIDTSNIKLLSIAKSHITFINRNIFCRMRTKNIIVEVSKNVIHKVKRLVVCCVPNFHEANGNLSHAIEKGDISELVMCDGRFVCSHSTSEMESNRATTCSNRFSEFKSRSKLALCIVVRGGICNQGHTRRVWSKADDVRRIYCRLFILRM